METANKAIYELVELIVRSAEKQALKKAVFSKPADTTIIKMVMTVRKIGGEYVLQAEYFHKDNKATHKNISLKEAKEVLCEIAGAYSQINLICTVGTCEYKTSKSGKSTVIGKDKLARALNADSVEIIEVQSNNIKKRHILSGDEPFLKLLGISDANGRIYDKKQLKFRQINRFVEMIRDIEHELPQNEIFISDLCCGKSYLSFAAYHYFTEVLGRDMRMTGVDLKPDVVAYCNEVAQKLNFNGLEFLCGDVNKYECD